MEVNMTTLKQLSISGSFAMALALGFVLLLGGIFGPGSTSVANAAVNNAICVPDRFTSGAAVEQYRIAKNKGKRKGNRFGGNVKKEVGAGALEKGRKKGASGFLEDDQDPYLRKQPRKQPR